MTAQDDNKRASGRSLWWWGGGAFAVVCLLELSARLMLPSLQWLDVLQPAEAGYAARANAEGVYDGVVPGARLGATFRTDERGRRTSSPLAAARYLTLGSSTTFGLGVADDQTWPAHLARLSGAEVTNGGLPGLDVSMALAAVRRQCSALRGKRVLLAIQRDDLAHTPAALWLNIPRGIGRWSRLVQWARLSFVPKGRDLIADPASQIDPDKALAALAELGRSCGFQGVVIQVDPLAPPPEQAELVARGRAMGLIWLDLSAEMEQLRRPGAATALSGDYSLSSIGHEALAKLVWDRIRGR